MAEDLIKLERQLFKEKSVIEKSKNKKPNIDLSKKVKSKVDTNLKKERSTIENLKKDKSIIDEKSKSTKSKQEGKKLDNSNGTNIVIKIESTDKYTNKTTYSRSNVSYSLDRRKGSIKSQHLSNVGTASQDRLTKFSSNDGGKMLELNISNSDYGKILSTDSKNNSSVSQKSSFNGTRHHHHHQHRGKSASLDPTKPIRPDRLLYRKKSESYNKKLNEIKKFPDSLGHPLHEGFLNSKNTFIDGRRSNDREWKHTYAVLRGHCLCLHPDKNSQTVVIYDTAISIRCAFVDIAYNYSIKRQNVFRLTTYKFSEFLFEASTPDIMLKWIDMIQAHGHTSTQGRLCKKILEVTGVKRPNKSVELKLVKSEKLSKSEEIYLKTNELPINIGACSKPNHLPITKDENSRRRSRSETRNKTEKRNSSIVAKKITHESAVKLRSWRDRVVDKLRRGQMASACDQKPTVILDVQNTFAINLDKCVQSTLYPNVPLFIEYCTRLIEEKGITKRGIYRIPGNAGTVALLESLVNQDPWTFNEDHDKWNDINAIISLLKLFFRRLPQPLITTDLYPKFIEANHAEDKTKRLLKIKRLIHMLPVNNFETLFVLARHLNKVASYEEENMMDARNLAIIFGPTLMQIQQETMVQGMVKDMSDQCHIIENIINYYSWFFGSWDEDVLVPGSESSNPTPVTSMDQSLLEKAEHHFLEGQVTKKLAKSHVSKSSARKDKPGSGGSSAVYSLESVYSDRVIDPSRNLRRDPIRTDVQTLGLLSVHAYGTSFRKCSSPVIGSPRLSPTYARSNSDVSDISRRSSYSGFEVRSRRTSKINMASDSNKYISTSHRIFKCDARKDLQNDNLITKPLNDLKMDLSKDKQLITCIDSHTDEKIDVSKENISLTKKIFPIIDIVINDDVISREDESVNTEEILSPINNHIFDEKLIHSIENPNSSKSKCSAVENQEDLEMQLDTIESQGIVQIFECQVEAMEEAKIIKDCKNLLDYTINNCNIEKVIEQDIQENKKINSFSIDIKNVDFKNKTTHNFDLPTSAQELKVSKSLDFLDSKFSFYKALNTNECKEFIRDLKYIPVYKILSSLPSSPKHRMYCNSIIKSLDENTKKLTFESSV